MVAKISFGSSLYGALAYNGEKIGQGRENAKQYLRDHPDVMADAESKVREHYGLQGAAAEQNASASTVSEAEEE